MPFKWSNLEYGKKFLTKLWNAARFIKINMKNEGETKGSEILDKWIEIKLERLISQVTRYYENFQFNTVIDSIRDFIWHKYCDQYIEAVKYRLYEDLAGYESRQAAQQTLKHVLLTAIKLLAPICPHMTETIYQMFKMKGDPVSIHQTNWPTKSLSLLDDKIEAKGDIIIHAISLVRRKKSEMRIPLKTYISSIKLRCSNDIADTISGNKYLIENTCRVKKIIVDKVKDTDKLFIEISSVR